MFSHAVPYLTVPKLSRNAITRRTTVETGADGKSNNDRTQFKFKKSMIAAEDTLKIGGGEISQSPSPRSPRRG